MYVLIDYDNLPRSLSINGPGLIADRLQERLITSFPSYLAGETRFHMRFYGGWHSRTGPTKRGAQVLAEVQHAFPLMIRASTVGTNVTIDGSVAEGLLALPNQPLPHTYRTYPGFGRAIRAKSRTSLNCSLPRCPADQLVNLFNSDSCPEVHCTKNLEDLVTRTEQKLVDAMLVADTIYLASNGERKLAVVSSDDDMWPGMLSAMSAGTMIFHVQTAAASNSAIYLGSCKTRYRSLGI